MRAIVILRHRFDPRTVKVSRTRGILDTRQAEKALNPSDKNALEEALRLRDNHGVQVTALALGPLEAEDILREALARGAEEAVLISDEEIEESLEALVLSQGVRKLGEFALIFVGHRVAGYGASQVGPRLAELLGLPQVTRAQEVMVADGKAEVKRTTPKGHVRLELPLPALLTVDEGANNPRYPALAAVISAYREREVTFWSLSDLGLDLAKLKGESVVCEVRETYAAEEPTRGERITGDARQVAQVLLARLRSRGLI